MFWEAFGQAWAPENHAKVYNRMHLQGLGPFEAESVSGSAFGKDLACIWADLGADWDTHWEPVGFCFSVWGLPLWPVDFLYFVKSIRDLSKSRVGQKLRVITRSWGPKQQTSRQQQTSRH